MPAETVTDPLLTGVPTSGCGIEHTLRVLDWKWTTLVVRELLTGPKRFGELRTALGSPSPRAIVSISRVTFLTASPAASTTTRTSAISPSASHTNFSLVRNSTSCVPPSPLSVTF